MHVYGAGYFIPYRLQKEMRYYLYITPVILYKNIKIRTNFIEYA